MKKTLNILLWILFALFFIVMGLLVATQTPWFRSTVKNKALELANKNIHGTLSVGELNGNFFTHLQLLDVTLLEENSDTLITIEEISLKYAPLRLLSQQIKVRSVLLDHPDIRLSRDQDSIWNFSQIWPKKEAKEPKTTKPFGFVVILDQLLLREGQIAVHSSDSLIPERLKP
ncbi:DUF748 domain-containing protein [Geofilum rubicundum]|uniref:Uncharacterized protein n=1 Tax=Geofilum rubicundum JCM 15548 TaxID=1236989 RepID=A0A0E9LXX3_9BACT|nr:AsmA family protein [Geofilum rubicundum]GAO29971.1 hypothetical protein JCM15548_12211 [Geofilum rubicundum JCM 15548]